MRNHYLKPDTRTVLWGLTVVVLQTLWMCGAAVLVVKILG
jgi:hypothetical protein